MNKTMTMISHQKSGLFWAYRQAVVFCLLLIIVAINFQLYLTNEFTPAGDGGRIYLYLKYLEKVPEIFPFWNSHKNHGFPLLADAENYMPLTMILNTESDYFNAQLNTLFFFLATIFAFTIRSISRQLGMSQVASLAAGVAVIVSVPLVRLFLHGTMVALIDVVLFYAAILMLLLSVNRTRLMRRCIIILSSIMLAWTIKMGYYIPLVFHVPALVLLTCAYMKNGISFVKAGGRALFILFAVSIFMLLFSAPILLPILDGLILSSTFEAKSPTIVILSKDIYNYTLALWPFIILALIFSKGLSRRYVYFFSIIASVNYILIIFSHFHFDSFFEFWRTTPILKNIRWQHPFRGLSSISAAFCTAIFIDSCRQKIKVESIRRHYIYVLIFSVVLLVVAYRANFNEHFTILPIISFVFILLALGYKNYKAVVSLCIVIAILMVMNTNIIGSPLSHRFHKAKNSIEFSSVSHSAYSWWHGVGYDKYTPIFSGGVFSMVFMNEYRVLLSLLYGKDIIVQRPHWVFKKRIGNVRPRNRDAVNVNIAELMAIKKPSQSTVKRNPFRVYDRWVVADEQRAINLMNMQGFSVENPIILEVEPGLSNDVNTDLKYSLELTGKTADTLRFSVNTNKNSILFVPEIYHRDWRVTVNGEKGRVIKAYASMRAVALPPGDHDIYFRFVYMPFWWGLVIFGATLMLSLLFLYRYRNHIKRNTV